MKKPGMSRYRVPYRQDRKDPAADAVATAVGGVAAVEVAAVAAVAAAGGVVDYDGAAGAAVAAVAERGTQTWDWGWERGKSKAGWVKFESRNPRQRHDTLRSALREHEGPGG